MKLTNNQIRQIIKEELDNFLNETMYGPGTSEAHSALVQFITSGPEGLNHALYTFDQVKGTGLLQPFEEDHIQRLSDYANASYRHKFLVDEMASIRKKLGVAATKNENWRALKKERSANLRAMRELENNINPRDKRMIAQVTGFA